MKLNKGSLDQDTTIFNKHTTLFRHTDSTHTHNHSFTQCAGGYQLPPPPSLYTDGALGTTIIQL